MKAIPGRWAVARMLAAVCTTLACLHAVAADGDDYPKRPIRLLLPNAAGSSSDVLGRILAQHLGTAMGQPVVVENYAGAGGLVGMEMGKNAAPDGYTLIAATPAGTTIAANLRRRITYDPLNDFQYVSTYAVVPNLLVVTPSLPVKSLQDLIEYAKASKADVFMASAGPGSQSHLAGAMLQLKGNFPSIHVPYKGGGASVVAVMSGEAQWTITPASSVLGHARSGRLRAIAHSLPARTPLLADIPAVAETVPGYSYSGWNGIIVPKGTPAAVMARIRAGLMKALENPQLRESFASQGAEVVTMPAEEFRRMVEDEMQTTASVVKAAKLSVD